MNTQLFQQAKSSYENKDFGQALTLFTQCLQDPANIPGDGEIGLLYHQIGNCLVRCKNYPEAIHAYTQATMDGMYDACGVVNYNLGNAYASLKDFDNAVRHYEVAVSDAKYATPYKAYASMGSALLKMGKSAEAGVAFREAALDERNPDPTKSLLNLGICFMALNRPEDAIASYESALPFDMTPDTKNRLMANLGQAYVATGQMKKAVGAFEKALEDKTYFLSDSAAVDYQQAIGAVAQGTDTFQPVVVDLAAQAEAQEAGLYEDVSGLDTLANEGTAILDPVAYGQAMQPAQPMYAAPYGQSLPTADDSFLAPSQADIDQWQRNFTKSGKKKRHTGLKIFLTLLIIVILLAAAGVFAYTQGYGYPMQNTVAEKLFANPTAASTDVFSAGLSDAKIQSIKDTITADSTAVVDAVDRGMNESTVYVTAKTPEGGSAQYKVQMTRDGIGWKVADVQLYFASQN
ncbi:MAG: tetratricopeptide repeat protein [Coriobacteriia bacterium]|nr:tetratricopeptide repeat protein [Coriobacteriia bacterium]